MVIIMFYGVIALLFGARSYWRVNDPAIRTLINRQCPDERRVPPLLAALIVGIAWPWFAVFARRARTRA